MSHKHENQCEKEEKNGCVCHCCGDNDHGHGQGDHHACGCGHHHGHDHHHHHHHHDHGDGCCCEEGIEHLDTKNIFLYIIGTIVLAIAFLPLLPNAVRLVGAGIVYAVFGFSVWREMLRGWIDRRFFTEFALMCVASVGAIVLREYADAAAVMYLYALGETISGLAGGKARKNIAELIAITPERVTVLDHGAMKECTPQEVAVGEVVLVRAGERIALDGIVRSGNGMADTSSVTGEQLPAELFEGCGCLSGSVLVSGSVEMEVTHDYENSVAAQLKKAVEEASSRKAVREKRISRLASVLTPAAFAVSLLIFGIGTLMTGDPAEWLRRGLVILVCSCPCSLLLSVPLTYFAGIGSAAGKGIVFRGGEVVDGMAEMETLLFDKTGTLTESALRFEGLRMAENVGMHEAAVIQNAYSLLKYSPHVAAQAFCQSLNEDVEPLTVSDVENIPGRGIRGLVLGREVLAGNAAMMADAGIAVMNTETTVIHVAMGGRYLGVLDFSSNIKEGAAQAVQDLKQCGVRRMALLSGDAEGAVCEVAQAVGIEEYYAGRMPNEKLEIFEDVYKEEKESGHLGSVGFCGDGLNDSAVIAASDVGIAMGKGGSAVTVEAADVVLMDDSPRKIVTAVRISRRIVRIAKQNIAISLGLKAVIAFACVVFVPSMELALIADVGAAVITVANAARAGKNGGAD